MNSEIKIEQNRIEQIDVLRFICCFLVVGFHTSFASPIHFLRLFFEVFAKTAVPIFFMISGFFYENSITNNLIIKQIKKLSKTLFFTWALYLIPAYFHTKKNDTKFVI